MIVDFFLSLLTHLIAEYTLLCDFYKYLIIFFLSLQLEVYSSTELLDLLRSSLTRVNRIKTEKIVKSYQRFDDFCLHPFWGSINEIMVL